MIVACKDCSDCKYFEMLDKFYMRCHARDKRYHYGQWVPCDDKIEGIFEKGDAEDVEDSKSSDK